VLVDVGGVAYELDVPMSTFYSLPATGEPVTLHTHLVVREDAHTLYGFATLEERSAFRQLIRISGIGKKTAERLLLELKGKLAEPAAASAGGAHHASDVVNALVALGYSDKEALAAVKGLSPGMAVSEAIRAALKALAKG
jgi:Holliday junction DNA helicase RuvA